MAKNFYGEDDDFSSNFDDFDKVTGEMDNATLTAVMAHEAKVDKLMTVLMNDRADSATRVEAAQFLGDSGVPKAISALRQVYLTGKKDKQVHKAVTYALGQFQALYAAIKKEPGEEIQDALQHEKNTKINERLLKIATGEMGKPSAVGRIIRILNSLLVVSLVLLVLLLILNSLPASDTDDDELLATPFPQLEDELAPEFARYQNDPQYVVADQTALDLLQELRRGLLQMRQAHAIYSVEYDAMISNQSPINCELEITQPVSIELTTEQSLDYFAISDIASDYSIGLRNLDTVDSTHQSACDESRPLTAEELVTGVEALAAVAQRGDTMETRIISQLPVVFVIGTPEPDETAAPDEPTPTEDLPGLTDAEQRAYIQQLLAAIGNVRATNGAYTLLSSFWNDVDTSGSTGGCSVARPMIPVLGPVPQDIIEAGIPELQSAWEQVMNATDLLRNSWDLFQSACTNQTLTSQVGLGKSTVDNVGILLSNANQALIQLR